MPGNEHYMSKHLLRHCFLILAMSISLVTISTHAQDKRSAKQFEKMVLSSNEPLFVDGERVYRPREVTQGAIVTLKPEPSFGEKARKRQTNGIVLMRVVLKASGDVRVLNVLKRLPNGLTEQALEAAARIRFKPAQLAGKPVSETILLQYNFNLN